MMLDYLPFLIYICHVSSIFIIAKKIVPQGVLGVMLSPDTF